MPTTPGLYIEKAPDWTKAAWTSVPNELLRNPELGWDAKGAFAWLASHQEMTFRVTAQMLADAGPRGRNHAYDMVRELERWGWITRHRYYNPQTGFTDIQVYRLHASPVPIEQRTYKPKKSTAAKTPTQGFVPGRSGTPIEEEKTKRENQGGYRTGEPHPRAGTPAPDAPAPPQTPQPGRPETWRCARHLAAPERAGADRPPCRDCKAVRERCERRMAEIAADQQTRQRACPMCDADGWRLDPATRVPVTPYDRCDHTTPHQARLRELADIEASRIASEQHSPAAHAPVPAGQTGGPGREAALAFRPSGKFSKPTRGRRQPQQPAVQPEARSA